MDPIEGLLQSKPGLSYPSHQSSEQAHSHLPQPQPKDTEKVRNFTSKEEDNSKRGAVRQRHTESINLGTGKAFIFYSTTEFLHKVECYSSPLKISVIPLI